MSGSGKSPAPWWSVGASNDRSTAITWTWRSTLTVGIIALLLGVGIFAILVGPRPAETSEWEWGYSTRPSINALAAQCGPTYTVTAPAEDLNVGTIPDLNEKGKPFRAGYVTTVPIIGIMSEKGVDTDSGQVYWKRGDDTAPRPEQVLRSLYDGWMVAYYSQELPADKADALGKYAELNPDLKMLVVPWPKDREPIPKGKFIAYAAWANTQQCINLLSAQVREFRAAHPPHAAPGFNGLKDPKVLTYDDIPLAILDPNRATVTGEGGVGSSASPSPTPSASAPPPTSHDPLRPPVTRWRKA